MRTKIKSFSNDNMKKNEKFWDIIEKSQIVYFYIIFF